MQTVQIALGAIGANEISRIAQNFQLRKNNVESAINLLLEGKSPSFIARYRRAKTAGMNEAVIRAIRDRLFKIKTFHDRREMILKALETQGKLTEELRLQILAIESPKRLEDLYLPLKPRKSILAAPAREKGLEPFAEALWTEDPSIANLDEILPTMINPEKGLETIEKITEGVVQILAEKLSEIPDVRASVRNDLWDFGNLRVSKTNKVRDKHGLELKEFFSYVEPLRNVQARKYLQIGKGEKNGFLNVLFDWDLEQAKKNALEALVAKPVSQSSPNSEQPAAIDELPTSDDQPSEVVAAPEVAPAPEVKAEPVPAYTHKYVELIKKAMSVAVDQILKPVLERECVRDLGERASEHAAGLLARFYHNRLVANPAGPIKILAIDPGFRNGCKIAVINEEGKLIDHAIIFPHQPQGKKELSLLVLEELIRKHQISTIALDNGNASKATEALLYELIVRLKNPKHLEEDNKEILPTEEASEKGGTDETVAESSEAPAAEAPVQISTPVVPEPVVSAEAPATEVSPAEVPPVTAADGAAPEPTPEALAAAKKAELAAIAVIKRAELEAQAAKKKEEIEAQKKLEKERRQAEYQKLVNDTKATIKTLPEAPAEVKFATVIEAGSSEYASSILGKEELADSDVGVRAAVSIGRRLQNPLNELIKIDPVHIVSGLVEFEVQHRYLRPALDNVLESCVNLGGADLNKCEASYLRHLSGLNQLLAQEIVEHRKKNGPFKNRAQLLEVQGLTPEKFELCAGFLQVHDGDEPFDATNFHPEDYEMAKKILDAFGIAKDEWKTPEKKQELLQKAIDANLKDIIATTGIDSVTSLKDFLDELINPLSQEQIKRFGPVYRVRQLDFEELQLGQELPGVVQNVVEFGCFVDVGIKESGLVHISQISARYVRSPYESVSVGDIVTVWVIALDKEKSRLSLTMINPNRESDNQGSGRSSRAPARDYPRRPDRRPDSSPQNAEANQGGDSQGAPSRPRSPERPAGRFPAARSNSGGSSSGGGSAGSSRSSSSFKPRDDKPRGARPPRLDPNRPPQIRTFSSQKPIEKPNLSQSALSGDSPLGTFAELAVFWEKSTPSDAGETKKGAETQNQASPPAPQKDQEGNGSPE